MKVNALGPSHIGFTKHITMQYLSLFDDKWPEGFSGS